MLTKMLIYNCNKGMLLIWEELDEERKLLETNMQKLIGGGDKVRRDNKGRG